MPITHAAKKALRKSQKRRKINLQYKHDIKDVEKQIRKLLLESKREEAKTLFSKFYKTVDKASKVGAINKNKASRLKSRRARLLNIKK